MNFGMQHHSKCNAGAQAGPQDAGAGAGAGAGQGSNAGGQKDESVTDVDFEEVK